MTSLNRAFTRLGMRRRYEAWFLRFGLADGAGAWWFRYLLTNPGRSDCEGKGGAPVQVWATWFPREGSPETFIQEFPISALRMGTRGEPFFLEAGPNRIEENNCCGVLEVREQRIAWDLRYESKFGTTLSNKGWIGFSRTPHSDAKFAGEVRLGEQVSRGDPLGMGLQGHNCGFRHRNFWTWMHACFPQADGTISTLEALVYEMPFGLVFRKAVLWHGGRAAEFRGLRESHRERLGLRWVFGASGPAGTIEVEGNGGGTSLHRLPYMKTDCSGTFEVSNNSRARARVICNLRGKRVEFETTDGAVLEMTGEYRS
jgi:hypothetical protein